MYMLTNDKKKFIVTLEIESPDEQSLVHRIARIINDYRTLSFKIEEVHDAEIAGGSNDKT